MPWLTYAKIAAVALILAGSFYMGKVWEQSSWQAKELEYQAKIDKQNKDAEKVAYDYETERTKRAAEQREIVREVYVEISKPVYKCDLPADGLRIINRAIATANSGKSGDAVRTDKRK